MNASCPRYWRTAVQPPVYWNLVDLVRFELTTSSMPWYQRALILRHRVVNNWACAEIPLPHTCPTAPFRSPVAQNLPRLPRLKFIPCMNFGVA